MTYQKQTLGSFEEPTELNRTFQVYNESPSSPTNLKRKIHENYEKMLRENGLIK